MIKTIISTVVLTLMISACIPMPHHEYRAPKIMGTLYDGDAPLGRTKIYLSTGRDECVKPYITSQTNAIGQFEIGPVKEVEYFVFFMGDPTVWWSLCLEAKGTHHAIMSQGGIGRSPSVLQVRCDVSQKQDTYINAFGDIRGKCTSIKP